MEPFEKIVSTHSALVMRVCRAMLGPVDAEDAWSDTFLAALRAYPGLSPDSNVAGWLATIARNKSIDLIRRSRRQGPTSEVVDPSDGVTAIEPPTWDDNTHADADLRDALATLAPKQQGAVVLHYLADLSYREVGQMLECSESAARRSAADGIAVLRRTYLARPDMEATDRTARRTSSRPDQMEANR